MNDLRSHFVFNTTPFTCEIPIDQAYQLDFFDQAMTGLRQAVENRMSATLIGPAGTGKTFILRTLRAHLPEARYKVRYLKVTDLSKRDMCREMAAAVGIPPVGNYPTLVRRLQETFLTLFTTDGLRPVIFIDEAHDMKPDVLAMIRLLTNFEMDSKLVISVILAGQPTLKTMLSRDSLSDIAHRLAYCVTLRLLTREETSRYLAHRLAMVGCTTECFAPEAVDALFEIGRGNLRAIDYLALTCLQLAADLGDQVVGLDHVTQARKRVIT
jgi:type II secretory pathway predicted ATPase ExeA